MRVLHLISGGDSGGAKTHVLSLLRDLNDNIDADLVCYMEADFSKEAREMGIPTRVFPGSFGVGLKNARGHRKRKLRHHPLPRQPRKPYGSAAETAF